MLGQFFSGAISRGEKESQKTLAVKSALFYSRQFRCRTAAAAAAAAVVVVVVARSLSTAKKRS